jgi:two-component system, NtrC family, sensor histidine kinase HydH
MSMGTQPGPEVAEGSGVTVTLAQPERPADPGQPLGTWHPAPRWPQHADVLSLAYYVLAAAALAAAGYPTWRVASVGLPALALQTRQWCFGRHAAKTCANVDPVRKAWVAVISQLSFFVSTCVAVAVTGAIASPLLVTVVTPYLAALLMAGDRRETRVLLAATGLAVCGLAAMPRAWTGPELPGPLHAAVVVLSVIGVGALLAPFHSAMRKMRDDLARAREEMASETLARARCLEQVGTKVAHELKNPLSAVKALVQLVVRDTAEARSQERLEVIEREIARMQGILGDYLSFTRPLQEVRPQPIDLGPLVADALLVLSAHADQGGVRLTSQGEAVVEADPRRLKDAVMNLVANAIEATPPGGAVDVEVRPVGEEAEIVVRDSGRGMAPETLSRLGTPFFTTREDGTGLGIVLARSVVAQHGGSLRYESVPGKGTVATVTLPSHPPARCPHAARAAR